MRYVVIFGFETLIYKKPPLFRFYLNDYFVDEGEFTVSTTNDSFDKKIKSWMPNNPFNQIEIETDRNFQRIYHIDITEKQNKLKIYLTNNDNNYTNGFMTQSTFVMLDSIYVIPENIFNNYNEFENNYRHTKKNTSGNIKTIKNYYKRQDITLFGNYIRYCKWIGNNGQKYTGLRGVKCGGNGYFCLDLKTKYNIAIPKDCHPIGFVLIETHRKIDKYKRTLDLE